MHKPVEQDGCRFDIAEDARPFAEGQVGCDDVGCPAPNRSAPPTEIDLSRQEEDHRIVGKREKPEDIVLLRQIEVLHGQGMPVADAVR